MSYGGFSFIFFRDIVTVNVTDRKLPSHQIVLNLLKENPMRSREETAGIMGKTFAQSRELWTSFPVKAGSGGSEQQEPDTGKLFRIA